MKTLEKNKEKINIVKIWSDSINKKNLKKIIKDAKKWEEKTGEKFVFISSGAVKLWKDRVITTWKNIENFSVSALASIWQKLLMKEYWKLLWKKELIWEILIDDYADEKHLTNTLYNLLENDVWIIINHNDTLHSTELNNVFDKSDNDKNTVFISKLFHNFLKNKIVVEKVIYLTNTYWLLDENKKTILWWIISSKKEEKYYKNFVLKNKSHSWTWWMKSKLNCIFEVLNYWVKQAIIANALNWLECLENDTKCTKFII